MSRKPDQSHSAQYSQASMSFGDHLEELRRRLMLGLAVPLPLMIVIFVFSVRIIEWLRLPATNALRANGLPEQMQVLSPTEMVVLQMKLSLICALVISAPWILYQAWKFIEPGLYSHEKRFVHFLLPLSAVLMAAGVALLYFGILPLMLRVLISFGMIGGAEVTDTTVSEIMNQKPFVRIVSEADIALWRSSASSTPIDLSSKGEPINSPSVFMTWPSMNLYTVLPGEAGKLLISEVSRSWIKQEYRLSEYINLVLMLMLAVAIAFQMPLVIALLGWLGLASPQWLRKQRRYALLICGLIAVVITPPDALSALLMLLPLYALYELGIVLLVIAPASAVAKGRVFSLSRFRKSAAVSRPDNRKEPMDQPQKTAQMDETVPRRTDGKDSEARDADGEGERP